jgi:hypothetical protein
MIGDVLSNWDNTLLWVILRIRRRRSRSRLYPFPARRQCIVEPSRSFSQFFSHSYYEINLVLLLLQLLHNLGRLFCTLHDAPVFVSSFSSERLDYGSESESESGSFFGGCQLYYVS